MFVGKKSKVVVLKDLNGESFGDIVELVTGFSFPSVSVARVYLEGPDIIHYHVRGTEIYIAEKGEGELFYKDAIFPFKEGDRVEILPHELHAARPKPGTLLVFLCVSSSAFDPADVYIHPKGRDW
ncbi:MAG: hypothetical protein HY813_00770 [Candidatus Portnoybacteria bacterium]|nr:hypothetical protein [Candidatus Portnoybacteria bacterium]